jgi:hypothetical protein
MSTQTPDAVNHPQHYTSHPSGIECIQITEHMGFNLGNALKYIWRCDLKKDAVEDLQKAIWYIEREIALRAVQTLDDFELSAPLVISNSDQSVLNGMPVDAVETLPSLAVRPWNQSVFDDLPTEYIFATVDGNGVARAHTKDPMGTIGCIWCVKGKAIDIGMGFDATNWHQSLICREFQGEIK